LCAAEGSARSCRSPREIDQLFAGDLRILGMDDTPGGLQGAKILTLEGRLGARSVTFRARWRAQSSADLINEPRKELAAYAVQKLFLADHELVVPPTAAYCFPLAEYRRFAPDQKASFSNVDCVFGFVTYWLEGVKTVSSAREEGWLRAQGESLWDPQLFERDATYRASVSNCNLLMHLINHGDAHAEQMLLEQTPHGLRAYVVDNSVAFLSIKNPMLILREDWSNLQVPSLPPPAIARLQTVTERDLSRLGTIQELELQGRRLLAKEPSGEEAASDGSEMSWHDGRLRIGLTKGEIALVAARIRGVLAEHGPKTRAEGERAPAAH
jgi:hypothetical protein